MGNSMNQTFSTQQMPVMIEAISYAGSAFGVNSNGEQVFINARIVDKCGLQEGMEVVALVLPNYEDKRDNIPWRALRVDDSAQAPDPAPEPEADPPGHRPRAPRDLSTAACQGSRLEFFSASCSLQSKVLRGSSQINRGLCLARAR